MALSIERTTTALVVIDLQKGIASPDRPMAPHPVETVVANAAKLADAFRAVGRPVFLVHVAAAPEERLTPESDDPGWRSRSPLPPDATDFVPELAPRPGDVVITKKQWGAFYGTELELQLRRRGIRTIVLCGISTNYGVESTARCAYEFGFQQLFAEDAMTSASDEMHRLSVDHVLKRIGRVRTTAELLQAMA